MTDLEQLAKIIRAHRTVTGLRSIDTYCTCGHNYGKLTDTRRADHIAQAIINAGWTAPPAQTSGYTKHGHPIPGIAQTGPPPTNRARCCGPRLCKQCAKETN